MRLVDVALARRPPGSRTRPPPLSRGRSVSDSPGRAGGKQPAEIVGEGDVPDQRDDRAGNAAATPSALESVPSIPFAPRLERTCGGSSRTARTTRGRGRASRRRRTGWPPGRTPASVRATFGSLSSSPRSRGARRGDLVGGAPAGEPRRVGAGRAARAARGSARRTSSTTEAGSCHAREHRRDLAGVRQEAEPCTQRLRGREVADPDHDLGRVRAGEPASRSSSVVVGDRGRDPGGRPRAGRRAAGSRLRRRTRGSPGRVRRRRDPRRSTRARGAVRSARLSRTRRARAHGDPGRPPGARPSRRPAPADSGSRNGKFRCTGPGRSPVAAATPGTRAPESRPSARASRRGSRPRRTSERRRRRA